MAKRDKMTDDDLAAIVDWEIEQAFLLNGEISSDRQEALNRYNQEPFGNEEEGLSKFVASDIADTIEWMMPQLVDVFVGGDAPVVFQPENAEDTKDANTETRYCQYVFERENHGVIATSIWFKDALLQKNGIIKAYHKETVAREREEYKGKTSQEYLGLIDDPEFELSEITITLDEREYSEEEYTKILAALPMMQAEIDAAAEYHIVGYRKRNVSKIVVENVAPENFFIQKDHPTIFVKDASFCGEWYEITRGELMEEGYEKDLIDSLPISNGIANFKTSETQTRRKKEGGITTSHNAQNDKSRELVMIYECYVRTDFNGDGYPELRYVRKCGAGSEYILENQEVDRNIYHALTPYINGYRFHGKSVAERMFDLVRAKSQLWRNGFDNMAYSAIPRKVVSGNVDTAALMTYIQGGIIKRDANATIENEETPFVAGTALEMADKLDIIRAERTGFSKDTMGLNPDALSNSNNMVAMAILSQSQLLIKMIATLFANSGFQSLMEHLRELTLKYEKKERVFDLTGETMTTDPRRWRKQRSSTPKVGIGFAGKTEEISTLQGLLGLQEKFILAQGGKIDGQLTNAQGIFNTATRLCKRMGIKDVETYFQNPKDYKPPAPQPSLGEMQMKLAAENINNQTTFKEAEMAQKEKQSKVDNEFKLAELQQKERLAMAELESKERLAELELIYKYGKDAGDRHNSAHELPKLPEKKEPKEKDDSPEDKVAHVVNAVAKTKKKDKEDTDKRHKEIKEGHEATVGGIKEIVSTLGDGLKEMVKAQKDGTEKTVAALTRKKKIKRGKDGKVEEVE